jgi:hypothetical protein
MTGSKLYPDAVCFAGAVEAASRDRGSWSAGERAALGRIVGQGVEPVVRMRRRWFFLAGRYTFVVERPRGGGYAVTRVPSS